jgi:hypothetical protein
LENETDSDLRALRTVYACVELRDLKRLFETKDSGPVESDVMTAFFKASKLIEKAPIVEKDGAFPVTLELQNYTTSVDRNGLEDILLLLAPAASGHSADSSRSPIEAVAAAMKADEAAAKEEGEPTEPVAPRPAAKSPPPPGAPVELPDLVLDQAASNTPGNKAPRIEFEGLADALLEQGKPTQAALVRFMADRKTATAEEVAANVHGNSKASDKAIGKNARETSDSLAEIGSRLSYRFIEGTMFRKIADE